MLQLKNNESAAPVLSSWSTASSGALLRIRRCRRLNEDQDLVHQPQQSAENNKPSGLLQIPETRSASAAQEVDPLYLFACRMAWEREEDPNAGWELISAAASPNADTQAHARALLSNSRNLPGLGLTAPTNVRKKRKNTEEEEEVKGPYELEIIENCAECAGHDGCFCKFSPEILAALNEVTHKMTLPAGAILFVEGQEPRGVFIVCSGRVNLSTTSREGKSLILKSAEEGHVLGVSATVSGSGYEITTETGTPCQIGFIDRKHFLELMETFSEVGLHTAQCLSRDYRAAYRDIHDLILTRSSAGKLAKLLLSQAPTRGKQVKKNATTLPTHEEMAQRIGASRETVTRLLSNLRRKRLIRIKGTQLMIRNRTALEALAV